MRIILVAPSTGLAYAADEVQAVVNTAGLSVRLLQGTVTERDIIEALRQQAYNCLWLATHGSAEGVLLSGGALLTTSALTALVRSHAIPLVFLNTCDSLAIAMQINQEAHAEVIATVSEVPDAEAYRTGALLAYHLGRGYTPRDAHEASRPGGNRTYIHLGHGTEKHHSAGVHPLEARVGILEREVLWLKRMFEPSMRQVAARVIFYGLLGLAWSLWMIAEIRSWLLAHPSQAILISVALFVAALIVRWLPEDERHE